MDSLDPRLWRVISVLLLAASTGCAGQREKVTPVHYGETRARPSEAPSAARVDADHDGLAGWLARIFGGELAPATFDGHWLDGGSYTRLAPSASIQGAKDIVRCDALSGEQSVLVAASDLVPGANADPLAIEAFELSEDKGRVLVYTNSRKVWRRNTRGDYFTLDLATKELRRIGQGFPESTLMFAKLSPDGGRAAYVQANDLYVEDLKSGARTRLTSDGSETIVNGTSDWVYEEELDVRDGFRWSPDGADIAFWHFDSSGVETMTLVNDTDTFYPAARTFRYPKAGTPNSAVTLGIVSAAGGEPRWVELPGDPRETYVARMEWVAETGELIVQQLNRLQNRNDVWLVDAATGTARAFFHDEDEAWLDVVDDWRWLPGGGELLWVSERDGWRHLWAVSRESGEMRLLTPGEFDVLGVDGIDEARGLVYFGASPDDATQRFLYRVPLEGGVEPVRVTPASLRGTSTYDVAPDAELAFFTRTTLNDPLRAELVRLPTHETVRVLEDNAALAAKLAELPPAEQFRIEIEPPASRTGSGEKVLLDGWMIRPPSVDEAGARVPLVVYVYGEPSAAQANDSWKGSRQLFHRALADAGYAVLTVDTQGTAGPRGRAWRKLLYGKVGVQSADELALAVRALLAEHSFLDPERVAAWGWSGGGTMTLHLAFRHPELFPVALSVAPVPDMQLYDSIYQERYLGLPQDNPEGYELGSPIHYADGLAGKLLLVHGSGDDNVHFQGTERLIDRLVELGKPFDLMVYPNRTHAISEGKGTSLHLHALLARYLEEHLGSGAPAGRASAAAATR